MVKTEDETILALILEAAPKQLKPGQQKNRVKAVKEYMRQHELKVNQVEVYSSKDADFLRRETPRNPPTAKQRAVGKRIGSTSGKTGLTQYMIYVVPTPKAASMIVKAKLNGAVVANWTRVESIIRKLGAEGSEPDINERIRLEAELGNYIDPARYGRESIQEILYDMDGEAARLDIAKMTGLTFDDFENARLAEAGYDDDFKTGSRWGRE